MNRVDALAIQIEKDRKDLLLLRLRLREALRNHEIKGGISVRNFTCLVCPAVRETSHMTF